MNPVVLSMAIQGSKVSSSLTPRKPTPTSDMVWTRVSNQLLFTRDPKSSRKENPQDPRGVSSFPFTMKAS